MNAVRIIIITALAVVFYRILPEYPKEFEYSLQAKAQVYLFHVMLSIGAWIHKVGGPRWGPIRMAFHILPHGSTPEGVKIDRRKVGDTDCLLVYPEDFFKRKQTQPAVVYLHGGGWVSGTPEFYLPMAYELIRSLDGIIVLPDYRIAPRYPFPVPFEDCLAVTEYLLREDNQLNVDWQQVMVMGDSAGGNLAAAVSLKTTKKVKMTILIYPLLQFVDFTLPSYEQNVGKPMVSPEDTAQAWLTYIGLYKQMHYLEEALLSSVHTLTNNKTAREIISRVDQTYIPESFTTRKRVKRKSPRKRIRDYMNPLKQFILEKSTDSRIAPLVAADDELRQLPVTYILTCEYDLLRDDGVLFAERLRRLGKEVTLHNINFGYHGIASVNLISPDENTNKEFDKLFLKMKTYLSDNQQ